ncbi:Wadjet anti-phage system protein JetD domain-containing protein [Pseudomonas sp. TCU-HL1]|uniref:Wadjet anti-phage system protein JetD domain-containing protein n=1 Tax=Pseudomonas sp. TCU-HL1 TaxID=1856685 RepID=UPI0009F553E6|nr:Wadjet anti-phage system protein JetD domain-containing protein [Pseudomonas sp. TCU-HL1]
MKGDWLGRRRIAYWGDMDTWGLAMLAKACKYQPELESVLMSVEHFEHHQASLAVVGPSTAGTTPPPELSEYEKSLYEHLLGVTRGRLEQEFYARSRSSAHYVPDIGISSTCKDCETQVAIPLLEPPGQLDR